MSFAAAYDKRFDRAAARDDDASRRDPQDMRYKEIYAVHHARSSGRAATPTCSRVERALKIAVPVTCIIIALFGAPLATSTQRGGSAYGIGVSLATTMIFLLMIQLTRGHRRQGRDLARTSRPGFRAPSLRS